MRSLELLVNGLLGSQAITIDEVTKDFGKGKGVYDVSFSVRQGEFVAVMGENGAGKSTLVRLLMDFVRPDTGTMTILGKTVGADLEIRRLVSYVPGEINFPDLKSGRAFLKEQLALYGMGNSKKADFLIKDFQLDIDARPKRMSKGMKEKLALVSALMAERPVLLLDEPTNGLDPLMREVFQQQMLREKKEGKTLLLVSNDYDEVEALCDKAFLLSGGRIVKAADLHKIHIRQEKTYIIGFNEENDSRKTMQDWNIGGDDRDWRQLRLSIPLNRERELLAYLSHLRIAYFYQKEDSLRDEFEERRKEE